MTHHQLPFDLTHALEEVRVPAAAVHRDGRILWLNRGAIELVGDRVGQPFLHAIAREDAHLVRAQFAKKLIGETQVTEYDLTLMGADGRRYPARVSSVPLRQDGQIIGTFGLAYPAGPAGTGGTDAPALPELTARQYEALVLLAEGLGTAEIAARLGVAEETARNHIRALLRQLNVHSRLEAVVRAYRLGLLRPGHAE
jgi:PAS domain S-box-containing protein